MHPDVDRVLRDSEARWQRLLEWLTGPAPDPPSASLAAKNRRIDLTPGTVVVSAAERASHAPEMRTPSSS